MSKKILDLTMVIALTGTLLVSSNIHNSFTTESNVLKISNQAGNENNNVNIVMVSAQKTDTAENPEVQPGGHLTAGAAKFPVTANMTAEERVLVQTAPAADMQDAAEGAVASAAEAVTAENTGVPATAAVTAETVTNRWNITLTDEEKTLLANIIWTEARGEGTEGEAAVVEVVFNRMVSDIFPDTLYDVLSQSRPMVQFCSWKDRNLAEPTETEYQVIENVLAGNTNILRNDTLYFSTGMQTDNLDVRIGNHYFCY